MNTVTSIAVVATIPSKPTRVPYPVFAIGLDQLYMIPFSDGEDVHSRCLAIDRYIDSNGWTWDLLIEEMAKPDPDFNRN